MNYIKMDCKGTGLGNVKCMSVAEETLVGKVMNLGFHKMQGISEDTARLLTSRRRLCPRLLRILLFTGIMVHFISRITHVRSARIRLRSRFVRTSSFPSYRYSFHILFFFLPKL